MQRSKIAGIGMYVPQNVVTNNDLLEYMDTSDEWIQERTGIKERRFADRTGETTTTMGVEAAKIAIERAGITTRDIDFIIFATICPDYYFPGCGVLLQRAMKMKEIGAWAFWNWNYLHDAIPDFNLITVSENGDLKTTKYFEILKNAIANS